MEVRGRNERKGEGKDWRKNWKWLERRRSGKRIRAGWEGMKALRENNIIRGNERQ